MIWVDGMWARTHDTYKDRHLTGTLLVGPLKLRNPQKFAFSGFMWFHVVSCGFMWFHVVSFSNPAHQPSLELFSIRAALPLRRYIFHAHLQCSPSTAHMHTARAHTQHQPSIAITIHRITIPGHSTCPAYPQYVSRVCCTAGALANPSVHDGPKSRYERG